MKNNKINNYLKSLLAIYDVDIDLFYDEVNYIVYCITHEERHSDYPQLEKSAWVNFLQKIKACLHFDRTYILKLN